MHKNRLIHTSKKYQVIKISYFYVMPVRWVGKKVSRMVSNVCIRVIRQQNMSYIAYRFAFEK